MPPKKDAAPKAEPKPVAPFIPENCLDANSALQGVVCWVREGESRESGPYQPCEIVDKKDTDLYVLRLLNDPKSKLINRSLTEMLGGNDSNPLEMHDLTKLMYIHEAAVSDVLKQRYQRSMIYSFVGAMLLVVNPFRDLKLTTTERCMRYRNMSEEEVRNLSSDPHVFSVCIKGLHHFMHAESNISFVISGESGAGKTETTKHILSFFTTPADGSDQKDVIS